MHEVKMVEQYNRNMLKQCVGQVCQIIGWNSIQMTPLEVMTDLVRDYIKTLAKFAHSYAELSNMTEPNLDHLALAFEDTGISVPELEEYVRYFDTQGCTVDLPEYPVKKESHLNHLKPGSREVVTRPFHIHEHLPPMHPHLEEQELHVESPLTSADLVSSGESPATPVKSSFKRPGEENKPSTPTQEDEGRPLREISVMMTTSGFLSSAREGKLPEVRTPVPSADFTPQPSPSETKVPKKKKVVEADVENSKPASKEVTKLKALKPGRQGSPTSVPSMFLHKIHKSKVKTDQPVTSTPKPPKIKDKSREPSVDKKLDPDGKVASEPDKTKLNIFKKITKIKDEVEIERVDEDQEERERIDRNYHPPEDLEIKREPPEPEKILDEPPSPKEKTLEPLPGEHRKKKRTKKEKKEAEEEGPSPKKDRLFEPDVVFKSRDKEKEEAETGPSAPFPFLNPVIPPTMLNNPLIPQPLAQPPFAALPTPPIPPISIPDRPQVLDEPPPALPPVVTVPPLLPQAPPVESPPKKKERRKNKALKDKIKKKKEKKEKEKSKKEKSGKKKAKLEEKTGEVKEKKLKKLKKKKEGLVDKEGSAVPKITLKLGPAREDSPDTSHRKIVIKPVVKPEGSPRPERSASPELAKFSPITQPDKERVREERRDHLSREQLPLTRTPKIPHPDVVSPSVKIDSEGNKVWICPACQRQDDGSPMIGCDDCDAWYHWVCVGIQVPPDSSDWYCKVCLQKRELSAKKKKGPKKKLP